MHKISVKKDLIDQLEQEFNFPEVLPKQYDRLIAMSEEIVKRISISPKAAVSLIGSSIIQWQRKTGLLYRKGAGMSPQERLKHKITIYDIGKNRLNTHLINDEDREFLSKLIDESIASYIKRISS